MTDDDRLRRRIHELMPRAREDLAALVAFPSVADPAQFPPQACLDAAGWVERALSDAGLDDCRLVDLPDGHPAVIGESPAPPGAPTVLLYCHYDVQPPLDEAAWRTPPFELVEGDDGRWYGRGAADCKGNVIMHLTALRALRDGGFPVGVKLIAEGAEEQASDGLERFVAAEPDVLRADVIVIGDAGNVAVGVPTTTTALRGVANVVVSVQTLQTAVHSGGYGGPAPDALMALIHLLSTLQDRDGTPTVAGVDASGRWSGIDYPEDRFRADATVLDGVDLTGTGSIADRLWARPAVSVLGIDCPPVVGSSAAVVPRARARVSLRVPPGVDAARAQDALVAHLRDAAPWNVRVEVERDAIGQPFSTGAGGPALHAMHAALGEAYGREATTQGEGGSIPLCSALQAAYPDAEILLIGVEEPACLIHAPNESVDPSEIEHLALAEALFLERLGAER